MKPVVALRAETEVAVAKAPAWQEMTQPMLATPVRGVRMLRPASLMLASG